MKIITENLSKSIYLRVWRQNQNMCSQYKKFLIDCKLECSYMVKSLLDNEFSGEREEGRNVSDSYPIT